MKYSYASNGDCILIFYLVFLFYVKNTLSDSITAIAAAHGVSYGILNQQHQIANPGQSEKFQNIEKDMIRFSGGDIFRMAP